jgi:hypothetical protein
MVNHDNDRDLTAVSIYLSPVLCLTLGIIHTVQFNT